MNRLYDTNTIHKKVQSVAYQLNTVLRSKTPNDIPLFICVLNGAYMFFDSLTKEINIPHEVDFIRLKSYQGTERGTIEMTKDIETDISDRTVVIVDDICDSGNTLVFLKEHLLKYNPKHIITVTMLTRKSSPKIVDYSCFEIENDAWVYGYGLDLNGSLRNLENIYVQ